MTATIREHPLASAVAAAMAAGAAWWALAAVSGLIFHLMPAAPTLAAAAVVRLTEAPRPGRVREAAPLVAGASIAVAASLVVAAAGLPLDDPPVTALAIIGGLGIGAWLLRPTGVGRGPLEP